MIEALRNALNLPDLRKRILITLGVLLVYRFASHVPVPGVDRDALAALLSGTGAASGFVSILNLLSGGAVARFSILAMGVYPYITASIIIQLLTPIIPVPGRATERGRSRPQQAEHVHLLPGDPNGGAKCHRSDPLIQRWSADRRLSHHAEFWL